MSVDSSPSGWVISRPLVDMRDASAVGLAAQRRNPLRVEENA